VEGPTTHIWVATNYLRTPGIHDRQMDRQTAESTRVSSWKLQDQPFTFCRRFGAASIFSTGPSACIIGFPLRPIEPEWKSAPKIPSYVSLQTQVSVRCKWTAIHCSRWRRSST